MAAITGLVISRETYAGAQQLAQMRLEGGIEEPLDFILVDLVGAESQVNFPGLPLNTIYPCS